jgi:hypothetical protein
VILIVDVPDNVSAAALSLAVSATGLFEAEALVTVEGTDQALPKQVAYRAQDKQARAPDPAASPQPPVDPARVLLPWDDAGASLWQLRAVPEQLFIHVDSRLGGGCGHL